MTEAVLRAVIEDSYDRLIAPAIERDIRNELTKKLKRVQSASLQESGTAFDAASNRRTCSARLGSGVSYRL